VDLRSSGSSSCSEIKDHPESGYSGLGTFVNGQVLICGGDDGDEVTNACYSWNADVKVAVSQIASETMLSIAGKLLARGNANALRPEERSIS